MTKHSGSKHLKRLNAPKTYPIARKLGGEFTVSSNPGPHPADRCIPVGVVLREVLGYARDLREVKTLLRQRKLKVDRRTVTDHKFPVGLMDVITVENEHYRILPYNGYMVLHQISEEESHSKILAIIGKRDWGTNVLQLSLEDGRNIHLDVEDKEERQRIIENYEVSDSLRISLPEQDILDHFKLERGNYCLIVDGKHMGRHGTVKKIEKTYGPKGASTITIESEGEEVTSAIEYTLIIGEDEPVYSLPSTLKEIKLRSKVPKIGGER
ncbi:MAG: 30S ribosomal protein S4e [Candidatus Korarchaeota archaeon]|nr:30S ribosomal protein S4e [Candidatus Korarchaeota archaeon]NIU84456.1 30S ribosomal protein S4e [Candidatus Thorarchaeota archaeon]NIW12939.1 30S ribosomal protein S4e [Candidatus Thorarchaeota archaeon]NIW51903.1 30S ribosomal protein S4e [Candidatus Korarchaeota archaeon]